MIQRSHNGAADAASAGADQVAPVGAPSGARQAGGRTRPCAVCGESRPEAFRVFFDGYVKLYQCRTCSFVAQYPGPGASTITEEYGDAYSANFAASDGEFMYPERHDALTDIARRIRKHVGAGGRLLDVGCGDGHFLSVCEGLGLDCAGVEPCKALATYASSRVGGEVAQCEYCAELFREESFDAITLIQVIEHLLEPAAVLEVAHRHLRADGLLAIEVPSLRSPHFLAYRLTGRKWFVKPPDGVILMHVGYFRPRSLLHLTRRCGYEPVSLTTGRWRVKYAGALRTVARVTDPVFNLLRVGGILYLGRKTS